MSGNKLTAERNQKILAELAIKPGNDICADCKARNPRWASHNLGIFICVNCATIHRKIGTHITKVKSITMDTWTKEQVDKMVQMGNTKSNVLFNPNEKRNPPPMQLMEQERDSELEKFIRSKYEYKMFIERPKPAISAPSGTSDKPFSSSLSSTSGPARPSTVSVQPAPSIVPTRSFSQPMSTTTPAAQSRIVSQPLTQQQLPARSYSLASPSATFTPATATENPPKGGVWNDLIGIQNASTSSSLPLQYSTQYPTSTPSSFSMSPNPPMVSPPMVMNGGNPYNTLAGGVVSTGMTFNGMQTMNTGLSGMNQFPMQQQTPNAFMQQPQMTAMGYSPQQSLLQNQTMMQSPQPMFAPQGLGPGHSGQLGLVGHSPQPMMGPGHSPQPMMTMSTTPQLPTGQYMSPSPHQQQTQSPSQFMPGGTGMGVVGQQAGMGMAGMASSQPPQNFASWAQGPFGQQQQWGSM